MKHLKASARDKRIYKVRALLQTDNLGRYRVCESTPGIFHIEFRGWHSGTFQLLTFKDRPLTFNSTDEAIAHLEGKPI